jgi:hypothetical protein
MRIAYCVLRMARFAGVGCVSVMAACVVWGIVAAAGPVSAAQPPEPLTLTLPLTQSLILAHYEDGAAPGGETVVLRDAHVLPLGNRPGARPRESGSSALSYAGSDPPAHIVYRGYLQFNTSGIPPHSTIMQAQLALTVDHFEYQDVVAPGETVDGGVYLVAEPWADVEAQWDWADNPAIVTTTGLHVPIRFNQRGVYTVDVTGLVRGWVQGGDNYGLMAGAYPDPEGVGRLTAILHGPAAVSETLRPRLTISVLLHQHFVYLPVLLRAFDGRPDLVVEELALDRQAAGAVQVRIANRGQGAARDFWVDLYLDPRSPPQANHAWPELGSYGAAWYVADLAPGGWLTLSIGDAFYRSEHSRWPAAYPAGEHVAWAYVDSWGPPNAWGSVDETDEGNNRYGPVSFGE